ncbi:MAG: hypothetical protein ACR2QJ_07955 [Geminicoccaceae bacterium]
MALYRGCPPPQALAPLKEFKIIIGIALASDELQAIHRLDDYSYVFVARRSQAASTLKLAVADLGRRNWSIDKAMPWVAVSANTQIFGNR